ncbi:MAG: galactose mutarotase [Bacteroides sp.]|nr:galactose mutarotase [Bacteroides sp.]
MNLYTLRNGDLTMQVTDFGARIISLFAPDRDGNIDDIIVGYGDGKSYVHNSGERFLGATVGRVANRIGGGKFTLDGVTYNLPKNNNGQTLHGGLLGVDMVMWSLKERTDSSVTLSYTAPDGQDGFPGNLSIDLTYTITRDNSLDIAYSARTDKATPVNLSNHAFYNLHGSKGGSILDHVLTINADSITPVDKVLIPTGEHLSVTGTPFDFREPHAIGERIAENHPQLIVGGGYDHNWELNTPADGKIHSACTVYAPSTGRFMEIFTDQPGLQFYSGNFFDGSYCGKVKGQPIGHREALALETQKWPDSINHPGFTDTVLRPGEVYTQHTVYKFSVK